MCIIQACGSRFGAILQSVFTIMLAVCAGIYQEWKLGLVGSLFVPCVLVAAGAQAKILASQDAFERDSFGKSAKVGQLIFLLLLPGDNSFFKREAFLHAELMVLVDFFK